MAHDKVLIYKTTRGAYWRANSMGYTNNLAMAGLYNRAEAEDICSNLNGENHIVELYSSFCVLQNQALMTDRALMNIRSLIQQTEVTERM